MGNGEGEMVNGKSKEQIVFFLSFLALYFFSKKKYALSLPLSEAISSPFTIPHFFLKGKNIG